MCKLKIKIKICGSKLNKFKKMIILPNNLPTFGKFNYNIGFWDTQRNKHIRYFIFNLYKFLILYIKKGVTPNKKSLYLLYYFFLAKKKIILKDKINFKLNIENEINK